MAFELLKVKTIERPNAVGYEDEEDESEIFRQRNFAEAGKPKCCGFYVSQDFSVL